MMQPLKEAFGAYMGRFYAGLVPTTKALNAYVERGLDKGILWAPARMIDAAEEMLASWQRNDTDQAPTQPTRMPIIIVAMASDYTPSARDFTVPIADPVMVTIPSDNKARAFGLRVIAGEVRAQIAFFAHDDATARSLAAQFVLFLDASPNRRFTARYPFAGQVMEWPVQIESSDTPAMSIQTEAKNLTILVVDVTLKAEIPLFDAPKVGEANDGKGVPGTNDPAGYPLVQEVTGQSMDDGAALIRPYSVSGDEGAL